jgi:hypothetical protein
MVAATDVGVFASSSRDSQDSLTYPFHRHFSKREVIVVSINFSQLCHQLGIEAKSRQRFKKAT